MKVGILTFHNAVNYGAVLQAYALQQVIRGMGADCEIIDYSCPAVVRQYQARKMRECTGWKDFALGLLSAPRLKKKKAAFARFVGENLTLSLKVADVTDGSLGRYDVIVAGSDQIFNPKNTAGDRAYLLDFPSGARKIAYAASIGNNDFLALWQERYHVDYQKLLRAFDALSFREQAAAGFVGNLLGQKYETVLDPVLLAGAGLWEKFCPPPEEDYIFVYNLGNIRPMQDAVRALQKKTGLKVYVANKDFKGDFLYRGYANASALSPDAFVGKLFGAKYVITDSFHGTAFSVLLHRNFYAVTRAGKENTNSRIENLLSTLNLGDRILSGGGMPNPDSAPEYDGVDERLAAMRGHSVSWLGAALGLDKEDK